MIDAVVVLEGLRVLVRAMVERFESKGEIFLWNKGNRVKISVVWGILQKKTMKQTEFEVQDILP